MNEVLPRPALIDLTQPWYDDACPELWVTAGELCELLGYGKHKLRHAKQLLQYAALFNIRIWHTSLLHDRYFFRLQLSDLDSIRKLRARRREAANGRGRQLNPIELFLERNKERLTAFRLG